jgi:thiosulfate/3-mercaptopyruvate sulfurtransferase
MPVPLVVLLAFLLVGCAAADRTDQTPPVADRDATILVSADRLAAQRELPNVVVLHVARQRDHFEEGHIPGARFLPLSTFAVNRDGQLNLLPDAADLRRDLEEAGVGDGDRVVVYGDFEGLAAARAFFALDVHGIDVAVLDGGLDAWQAAGHAVTIEETPPADRGSLTLDLDASQVLLADDVATRLDREETVLVDARPPAQHTGAEAGEAVPRPGHIPGSVNLFWEDDLREDGTLRPVAELRARYAAAGVTPEREVVTYCRTGVQASHAYLVTRLIGLDPLIYDGSFHDWSNNTDYPVATGS